MPDGAPFAPGRGSPQGLLDFQRHMPPLPFQKPLPQRLHYSKLRGGRAVLSLWDQLEHEYKVKVWAPFKIYSEFAGSNSRA